MDKNHLFFPQPDVRHVADVFWEAEVRCCIAVKPSHSESCLTLAGELQFSHGLTQNEMLPTSAIGRHRKLLIACFDLKQLQAFGLHSALV